MIWRATRCLGVSLNSSLLRSNSARWCLPTIWRSYSNLASIFGLTTLETPAHHAVASKWIDDFKTRGVGCIPKDAYEVNMSRSSGPGGQNVNKLNTKATLRCLLPEVGDSVTPSSNSNDWLPPFVIPALRDTPYHTNTPSSLLITSSLTRSAAQNRLDAILKLHSLILSTARSLLVTPTSDEQRERVKALMRREDARRKAEKARRGERKGLRKKGGGGGWE